VLTKLDGKRFINYKEVAVFEVAASEGGLLTINHGLIDSTESDY